MRSTILICLSAFLLLLFACSKYKAAKDDLSGQNYLRGRIFFADTLNHGAADLNPLSTFLPGATVYLSYATDSMNKFIYSTTADQNGYFTFANLQNQNYWVFGDTVLDSGIYYMGYTPVQIKDTSPNTVALSLYPSQTMQNGVLYIVKDPTGTGYLTGAQVCLYSSPTAYQYAIQTDSFVNYNYSCATNGGGHAFQLNMAPGFYNVIVVYTLGASTLTVVDTITVGHAGIIEHIINM